MKALNLRPMHLLGLAALAAAAPAQAHHMMGGQTPTTGLQGLLSGLAHPVIGVDHFAFLVVVALLSFALRGGARMLVPVAFVAATVVGTLVHLASADLPLAETVIALSVLLGGVTALLRKDLPALLLGAMFAGFGLFHGYAYGESIVGAEQTPLLAYLIGFALVQYAAIVGGVRLLDLLARRSEALQLAASRAAGAAAALAGGLFLAMSVA